MVHYVLPVLDRYLLLYSLEFGIWNLDHLVTCGIPYANTYGIPRNSGQFYCKKYRGIPRNSVSFSKNSVFRRKYIKNALPWTPY
jgi:hypothetical protein